ncbi:MAG: undecaprenyl-diphosphate phosphatase [Deltaproteobacteria bacterium]|nr:undecaprenyl-diphosphate phosphatase [Candidatus Anaeroferrophillacea bacterium]
MDILQAVILGIVQGVTEFLPVSSSGHLVIGQHLLPGFRQPGVAFDVILHGATLLAVVIFFRRDIGALVTGIFAADPATAAGQRRLLLLLVLGTIPTGIIGVGGKDLFVALFENPVLAGAMLLVTGTLLLLAHRRRNRQRPLEQVRATDAVVMGITQGLAIIPGISRSGSTIAVGMLMGVEGTAAARLSFLLSIPAITGAVILSLPDISAVPAADLPAYLGGGGAAFAAGLLSLRLLIFTIEKHRLGLFAGYCFAAGIAALAFFSS